MKNYISNLIAKLAGADALLIRIQTLDTLVQSQALHIKDLEAEIGTVAEKMLLVQSDIEDFVTERNLDSAIEGALNDQDWDSIVSDTLSERRTSSALDEAISDALRNQDRPEGFNDEVVGVLVEELSSGNKELINAIAFGVNNYNYNAAKAAAKTLPVS